MAHQHAASTVHLDQIEIAAILGLRVEAIADPPSTVISGTTEGSAPALTTTRRLTSLG
jgi:hypothetical protein